MLFMASSAMLRYLSSLFGVKSLNIITGIKAKNNNGYTILFFIMRKL